MGKCQLCGLIVLFSVIAFVLGFQAQAQLTPPPPTYQTAGEQCNFTEKDRALLSGIWKMVRSIRAKLFPLEEEQQILRLNP